MAKTKGKKAVNVKKNVKKVRLHELITTLGTSKENIILILKKLKHTQDAKKVQDTQQKDLNIMYLSKITANQVENYYKAHKAEFAEESESKEKSTSKNPIQQNISENNSANKDDLNKDLIAENNELKKETATNEKGKEVSELENNTNETTKTDSDFKNDKNISDEKPKEKSDANKINRKMLIESTKDIKNQDELIAFFKEHNINFRKVKSDKNHYFKVILEGQNNINLRGGDFKHLNFDTKAETEKEKAQKEAQEENINDYNNSDKSNENNQDINENSNTDSNQNQNKDNKNININNSNEPDIPANPDRNDDSKFYKQPNDKNTKDENKSKTLGTWINRISGANVVEKYQREKHKIKTIFEEVNDARSVFILERTLHKNIIFVAFFFFVTTIICLVLIIFLLPLKEKEPYLVAFSDATQNFVTIERADTSITSNEALVRSLLGAYILNRETINNIDDQKRFEIIKEQSSAKVWQTFEAIIAQERSVYGNKDLVREVEIANIGKWKDGYANIDVNIRLINSRTMNLESEKRYRIIIVYKFNKTKIEFENIPINPTGFQVVDYAITRIATIKELDEDKTISRDSSKTRIIDDLRSDPLKDKVDTTLPKVSNTNPNNVLHNNINNWTNPKPAIKEQTQQIPNSRQNSRRMPAQSAFAD